MSVEPCKPRRDARAEVAAMWIGGIHGVLMKEMRRLLTYEMRAVKTLNGVQFCMNDGNDVLTYLVALRGPSGSVAA
jgi:hypothetical protein